MEQEKRPRGRPRNLIARVKVHVYLRKDVADRFREWCRRQDRMLSHTMDRALTAYIDNQEDVRP